MTHTPNPADTTPPVDIAGGGSALALSEQARLGELSLEISIALTRHETLRGMLASCTEELVRHLDAAFARIWILNEAEDVLELQASSGMYTHLNGSHSRVPVGALKIGLIAAERKPHLTNSVPDDPRVGDQDWARREGMISFAGYPLLVEDRLIGVVAMFARHPLNDTTLQAMAAIANGIAIGIERLRMQEERVRLLAREELKKTQERLTLSQQIGRVGTFEWDVRDNRLLWTPELEALYGLTPGESGDDYQGWASRVHPDDVQITQEQMRASIESHIPFNIEYRVLWPDGTIHWLVAKGEATYDEQGKPNHLLGVQIDITDRKTYEQQLASLNLELQELNATLEARVEQRTAALDLLNTELRRSNQELQDFAYVASHDLQEPLRKIQAFGNLLEEEYGQALGGGKVYLDRMRNAAARMRTLIDDLLTFSRVTTKAEPFIQVNLTSIVQQVVDDLESRLQASHGSITIGELPSIEADPRQMYQLFSNLLANALKFHRPGIAPVVNIWSEMLEDTSESSPAGGQHCTIFVKDNGIGFDEKYLDRIFTVFQRLHGKEEYEGTGIGLAVVRKIVERHGGSVTARSKVGEGTTFIVTMPLAQQQTKENATL